MTIDEISNKLKKKLDKHTKFLDVANTVISRQRTNVLYVTIGDQFMSDMLKNLGIV